MKKIISIVLVTLMVLACMPLSFLAAGVSATDVAKIGNTGYATLDAAVAAVKDGETIVLLKDADLSALNRNAISYTIDGQNKAYTVKTTKVVTVGNGNVTFKNLNLTISGDYEILVDTNDNGDITFDGCYVKTSDNKSINHRGKGNVTFKSTTVESYAGSRGDSCIFYMRGDHANVKDDECVWTIEDSTIINYTGSSSSYASTSIFCLASSAGATYKFNLKGNTVIKNASKTANVTCGVTLFAITNPKGSFIINADPTVELVLAAENVTGVSGYFYVRDSSTTTPKISLNGTPKFIASPKVVAAGIEMPDIVHKDDSQNIRYTNTWSADGKKTTFNTSVDKGTPRQYKATVTENVTFTPINVGLTAGSPNVYGVRKFDGVIEYYPSLSEAKFRTRAGESLVFLADYTATESNFFTGFMHEGRTFNYGVEGITKADGNQVKLTANFTDYGDKQVTFKNLKIQFNGKFNNNVSSAGTGVITFDKCDVTTVSGINIKRAVTFNVIDSTLTSKHSSCMFWMSTAGDATVNIVNSHLIYEGNGTGVDACLFDYNSTKQVVVNVKGNSVLEWKGSGASNAHIAWEYATANKGIINMDDSVVIYLNPQNSAITGSYFFGTDTDMTMAIKGNPTYKVNDIAAKNGFVFYKAGSSINDGKTGTSLGYVGTYNDGSNKKVIVDNSVASGKLTKGFSVKYTSFGATDFDVQDGAAIRTQDESGIRFSTVISNALLNVIEENATFGTIIANMSLLNEAGISIELDDAILKGNNPVGLNVVSTRSKWQSYENGQIFRVALIGIPDKASAYTKDFGARSYMTVTYADGTTNTFYTYFDDNNVRSMHTVSENLYAKHIDPNNGYTLAAQALTVVTSILETVGMNDRITFEKNGLNIENYREICLGMISNRFYNSNLGYGLQSESDWNNANWSATKIFTKEELPVGSVIIVDPGYEYRPEGWIDANTKNATRPDKSAERLVVIDDAWWGEFTLRGFNFGKAPAGAMTDADNVHMRIYVPVSSASTAHTHNYVEVSRTDALALQDGEIIYKCSCGECDAVKTVKIPATRTLKVLAIGNSFTEDSTVHLWNICKDAGINEVVVANMFIGNSVLDLHWTNISGNKNAYQYQKNTDGRIAKTENYSIYDALKDEDWDFIVLHQASGSAGQSETYANLDNIIKYINDNTDAKILWNLTWAYQSDSTHSEFPKYDRDQMKMYETIVARAKEIILPKETISAIIPTGTTIQNLRTSYIGDKVTRDGYHLNRGFGRYTASLTWYAILTGGSVDAPDWIPSGYPDVEGYLSAIRDAVKGALKNNFAITESTVKTPNA